MKTESLCPWCEFGIAAFRRMHDDGTEYRCPNCGMCHTRKEGSEDAFAFFPPDIDRAFTNDVKPLFPEFDC